MPRRDLPPEDDEDDVPWLEPAGSQRRGAIVPSRTLIAGAVLLIVLVAGIVWGVRVLVEREEMRDAAFRVAAADAPIIRAPDQPYKHRPADPGGAELDGIGQTIYEAGGGEDPGGEIALDQLPEQPMERPGTAAAEPNAPTSLLPDVMRGDDADGDEPAAEAAAPAPAAAPAETAADAPAEDDGETSGGGRYALQLGAFSSKDKADDAWKSFSGRYRYLDGLDKDVEKIERDGKALFRLRAVGVGSRSDAENLCGRLKVAGEACLVAN